MILGSASVPTPNPDEMNIPRAEAEASRPLKPTVDGSFPS